MIGALVGYLVGCLKHRSMSVMMILQLEHTKNCKRSTKGLTVLVGLDVGLGVLAIGGFVGVWVLLVSLRAAYAACGLHYPSTTSCYQQP